MTIYKNEYLQRVVGIHQKKNLDIYFFPKNYADEFIGIMQCLIISFVKVGWFFFCHFSVFIQETLVK
jgi:hypothetical protein